MEVYDFGERLQKARNAKKLSQTDVAKRLGVHRQTVSSYERNSVTPSYEALRQMAVMYDTSLDYLAGLSDRKAIYLDKLPVSLQMQISDLVEKMIIEYNKTGD